MKTNASKGRRKFLLAAGLGGATAAAAAMPKGVAAGARKAQPKAKVPDGYRVTEHIRKYYRTTEV